MSGCHRTFEFLPPSCFACGRIKGKTTMIRSLCIIVALLAASTSASAQNNEPSGADNAAEEKACSGDAKRLCKNEIPDDFRVASCLQEHRAQVSRPCRAVLEGHGM
jgi:hypothetical protein